jgi:molecular chaperone HtpG
MDNCEEFIPEYMNFLKGIVDSDDLKLNISFEQLQPNQIIKMIMKTSSRKDLNYLISLQRKKMI